MVIAAAHTLSPLPAGPPWLTAPLAALLLISFAAALRVKGPPVDTLTLALQVLAGFLLLAAGIGGWAQHRDVALTDVLLYGAAQMWILAYWGLRPAHDDEDEGPADSEPPAPPWWPDFERDFRDYARRGPDVRTPA